MPDLIRRLDAIIVERLVLGDCVRAIVLSEADLVEFDLQCSELPYCRRELRRGRHKRTFKSIPVLAGDHLSWIETTGSEYVRAGRIVLGATSGD